MKSSRRKVVLTGGGTVGHVMLNKLLIPEFLNQGAEPVYIGSKNGIEKEMISSTSIQYRQISSGKLRRYISFENLKDIFKVTKGIFDARRVLKREQPEFVFSKGGFVSVPVVLAAKSLKIPVYIHESDLTPGLANKISVKFATKCFVTFEKTLDYLPTDKTELLGPVIRDELSGGQSTAGYRITGFTADKPVLLFMGGSLGARSINAFIRDNIEALTEGHQVIHLCGKGNTDESLEGHENYIQFEFVDEELAHLIKISDVVIGRSGSNAIYELLLNQKPMILIPLPLSQSRGDQLENARYFSAQGYAEVIEEEVLTLDNFQEKMEVIVKNRDDIIMKMAQYDGGFKPETLVGLLLEEEVQ
ncbi:undecaprenyldiphospho-muramoylpentapeptide beta-N-acetylglucosaminyltransferase [Lacicoccus alkaliphilus]|uniref:UDP-N-acetylglucosamine--N-acetylmuramyl-(pentapeptide) pyrophosphoryl-undecaprenol N-acetylglucosamine transferase n=1 Tax=Lacicoccus alkaliphilus DSM 16010 TaxID=1123231 RepID=A0A1M7B507_9BACL|nr:undecaprenyldiphospho-muramoylpentapeptide beta-N-acetylglucosaminyltransferase [Salinicoccus alkaliphilus]SHL49966.1 UDP-N-acetylglucosamine-N-acetylmuramylpentapeptide N-acetylglucosamine transferase [Salinicoccus alkaliphilus DSM 16010]